MKELTIKIRLMNEEELKQFQNGRWSKAYEISIDNFKTWYQINPCININNIIDTFKKQLNEL